MQTEELINVGQAVAHGNTRRIKNLKTEKEGAVVSIVGDTLTVQLEETTELWSYQDCEEVYS